MLKRKRLASLPEPLTAWQTRCVSVPLGDLVEANVPAADANAASLGAPLTITPVAGLPSLAPWIFFEICAILWVDRP